MRENQSTSIKYVIEQNDLDLFSVEIPSKKELSYIRNTSKVISKYVCKVKYDRMTRLSKMIADVLVYSGKDILYLFL